MTYSIKDQVSEDLKKVKQQGGDRAQRIKEIVKAAVTEAWTEAKDGTEEVKSTSKASLSNAVQSFLTVDEVAAEQVLTVAVVEDGVDPEVNSTDAATETTPTDQASLAKSLLKAARLRAQAFLGLQYDKLPDRYEQLKQKTATWDEQLAERYGDDYAGLKQRYAKVADWYQSKWSEGQELKPNPVERKQEVVVEELSDLGTTIAQKEEVVKQKMGQVLRTITVNAES